MACTYRWQTGQNIIIRWQLHNYNVLCSDFGIKNCLMKYLFIDKTPDRPLLLAVGRLHDGWCHGCFIILQPLHSGPLLIMAAHPDPLWPSQSVAGVHTLTPNPTYFCLRRVTPLLPSILHQPSRTVTYFGLRRGKRKTVRAVTQRFMRLHSGLWIRRKVYFRNTCCWVPAQITPDRWRSQQGTVQKWTNPLRHLSNKWGCRTF